MQAAGAPAFFLMVEVRCQNCGAPVPALLGETRVQCGSCGSESSLSDEVRSTLRAIAEERARTDLAGRKLQEARQRLGRSGILWPLREHPVILGLSPAALVLAPVLLLASGTRAYSTLRLPLLFVLFGVLYLIMLYPFIRYINRRRSASLDIVRALPPLLEQGNPRCRCCGAEIHRPERGIVRCEFCGTESLVDDRVFYERETRLRDERRQQEQEISRRLTDIWEEGVGAYAVAFTFGGILVGPAILLLYAHFPVLFPLATDPGLLPLLSATPAAGTRVLVDRAGDGMLRVMRVQATKGERVLLLDERDIDWTYAHYRKLRPFELRRGNRVLLEEGNGLALATVAAEERGRVWIDEGHAYSLFSSGRDWREHLLYSTGRLLVPGGPAVRPKALWALAPLGVILGPAAHGCGQMAPLGLRRVEPGGPGARAGLRAGDLITGAGGEGASADPRRALLVASTRRVEPLPLLYCRGGRPLSTIVYPATPPGKLPLEPPPIERPVLGARVLTDRLGDRHLVPGIIAALGERRVLVRHGDGEDWQWVRRTALRQAVLAEGMRVQVPRRGRWMPGVLQQVGPDGVPCVGPADELLFPRHCEPAGIYRVAPTDEPGAVPGDDLHCRILARLGLGLTAPVGPLRGEACGPGRHPLVCVVLGRDTQLRPADRLLAVDGRALADQEEVAGYVRGLATGSLVRAEICRKTGRLVLELPTTEIPTGAERP